MELELGLFQLLGMGLRVLLFESLHMELGLFLFLKLI
jgi:hypothetical protein